MVGTAGTTSRHTAASDVELDREIDALARALQERGPLGRDELERVLDARRWGPRRFRRALRETLREERATQGPGRTYGPPERARDPGDRTPAPR